MVLGKHMNRYYLKNAVFFVLGIFVLIVEDYLMLMVPAKYPMVVNGINDGVVTVDGVVKAFDMPFLLNEICMPLVLAAILMILGRFLWRALFLGSAIRMEADLRERMFDKARTLDADFYGKNKIGGLMSLFTNDLDTIQECFGWGMVTAADAVIMGSMSIGRMAKMDGTLTVLSLIPMGILLITATAVGKYMAKKWRIRQEAFSKLSDFTQERVSGMSVVKAFVKEKLELNAFKKLNLWNEKTNMKHTRASVLMRILVTLFVQSVTAIILAYGGFLVHEGSFNAGQLVEFVGYFTNVVFPVMAVSELIDMTSRGKASLQRISELLDAQPQVADKPDAQEYPNVRGEISVENLSFAYPGTDRPVLQNITLKIQKGEKVGIVGRTGSGKTTLAELLLRIYNVPDGTIFLDGQDINTLRLQDLRRGFAYVPQDNFLFSDTLERNIAFGVSQPQAAAVVQAAVAADVDENIRGFSEGYQTVLGERGVTISGGQKQRVSIARAFMKDASVLIMDDSVSAVDTKTEKNILNNMQRIRQGKTTLVIAHRITTVESMDRIFFLDNGRLIAEGTHENLLETCPAYANLVQLQQLEQEGTENE